MGEVEEELEAILKRELVSQKQAIEAVASVLMV